MHSDFISFLKKEIVSFEKGTRKLTKHYAFVVKVS